MRSTLFEIPFDGSLLIGGVPVPLFGFGLVLAVWCLIGLFFLRLKLLSGGWGAVFDGGTFIWIVAAVAIVSAPSLVALQLIKPRWPVFGWGMMLFIGFWVAAQLGSHRLKWHGFDPEIAWDIAFWGVPAGIIGARVFHIIQYRQQFIGRPDWIQFMLKLFNLPDGGLVFYGGLIAGVGATAYYYHRRKLPALLISDLLVPSVLIGLGFGRLGCFLNGCCFGDVCRLPWAVTFPQNSPPFVSQRDLGLITGDALRSLPVHPSQIYSAFDAFVLAFLAWNYFPYRRRNGDVIVLGLVAHGISRFLIEFLRADEGGQFGTALTISQWISLGVVATGIALAVYTHGLGPTGLLRRTSVKGA